MALSVDELIVPITKEQALELLLDILRAHGFPVSSWQSGSKQRTMIEAFAELASEELLVANELARAGLLPLSTGGWLTLLADSHYDEDRFEAKKTVGKIQLADAESTGPHVIGIDEMVISDADGRRFRNITGGTLTLAGNLELQFEAEVAGSDGNVEDETITVVVDGPPGVTVTNLADWIITAGANEESDPSLQERCRTKWAGLGVNGPAEAYVNWAREADSAVTRVFVDDTNPDGPGTLTVYIAGDDGAVTGPVVTAVTNYIEGTTDQVGRLPIGALLTVESAVNHAISFTGTVYFDSTFVEAEIQEQVEAAIEDYFKTVPIGGVRSIDDEDGEFLLGGLYHSLFSIPGGVNIALTAPITNVALALGRVAVVGSYSGLTYAPAAF